MKIKYAEHKFKARSLETIEKINVIIDQYGTTGYSLTLRQLYYQLVARGIIENTPQKYEAIGDLVNKARLAGLIDWEAITDRTRKIGGGNVTISPEEIILRQSVYFSHNRWDNQPNYVEVWVEKDALTDVVKNACFDTDTPYFACRGYCSQSAMWIAAQRFIRRRRADQKCYILYLGDHDPCGMEMTRDIADRMKLFGADVTINRLALNMDQIISLKLPPNTTKESDSNTLKYRAQFGDTCWELDALEPQKICDVIKDAIKPLMDEAILGKTLELESAQQQELALLSGRYHDVIAWLKST